MRSYTLIHQLISMVEDFEKRNEEKELSMQDFAGFFMTRMQESPEQVIAFDERFGSQEDRAQQMAFQVDNTIGRLFIYLSRYAKSYIKKALEGTPLQTAEDFTCLAILLTHDHLSKSELITRNIQEKTSGTEVIRRLLAGGLAAQWDDENDKRGKRISITEKGKELLYRVFEDMNFVGKMISGNLTPPEKLTLQYLLQKLESFHYNLHETKSISGKDDLKLIAGAL
ncbi:MAG: winged helix DNA-binding protein [Chitinophagaceae bacterium]|nr:winged helix DNA-binding protein [Chitinophagaceae bacterium]